MKLKKRNGASTILVLFMVIVLVTLGLFTILSANINYNLSMKANSWNTKYYGLDSQGSDTLLAVDKILLTCENQSVQYVMNDKYSSEVSDTIPQNIQDINRVVYMNDDNNVYKVMNNTYKFLVFDGLSSIAASGNNSEVNVTYNPDGGINTLSYSQLFSDAKDPSFQLSITVDINDLPFTISNINGTISGVRNENTSRYTVTKWQQSQIQVSQPTGLNPWIPANADNSTLDITPPSGDPNGALWNPTASATASAATSPTASVIPLPTIVPSGSLNITPPIGGNGALWNPTASATQSTAGASASLPTAVNTDSITIVTPPAINTDNITIVSPDATDTTIVATPVPSDIVAAPTDTAAPTISPS